MPGEKKRRKKVAELSDSDNESTASRLSQVSDRSVVIDLDWHQGTLTRSTRRNGSTTAQARPSVVKEQKKDTAPKKEKAIYSFFNAATQRQQAQPSASPTRSTILAPDDLIQDDEEVRNIKVEPKTGPNPFALKRKRKPETQADRESSVEQAIKGSQAFKRPTLPPVRAGVPTTVKTEPDTRPWTDRYAPKSVEELAVHKKKVTEVQQWIGGSRSGHNPQALLILKGPAGCGKTQTLRLVAQAAGCSIQEWGNPTATGSAEDGFRSMSAQFDDFIGRAGLFGSLTFSVPDESSKIRPEANSTRADLILIEEFPSTILSGSAALTNFRSSVLQYILVACQRGAGYSIDAQRRIKLAPIVIVISESTRSAISDTNDAFTAHRLFGSEIMQHPGVGVIEFNPIAPTFMTKALDLILTKDARITGRKKMPGSAVFDRLAELGDIRSAIMSLEFLCVQGDDFDWTGKVAFAKGKKATQPPSKFEIQSLTTLSQRESAIGIFHSLGRVLHNKRRVPVPGEMTSIQPPAYLPQFARPKSSEVDVDLLLNELGTDVDTFVGGLHENFVLSCQGIDNEETLDHTNGCLDALSDADLLSPSRFGSALHAGLQGRVSSQMRQDDLAFHTAARGLLFSLPHPVKRSKPPAGYNGTIAGKTGLGGFQMYYPRSMQLWRSVEEYREVAERLNAALQRDHIAFPALSHNQRPVSVDDRPDAESGSAGAEHVLSTRSGRIDPELLLELLPYLDRINGKKRQLVTNNKRSDLSKLVTFGASSASLSVGEEDDEDDQYINAGAALAVGDQHPANIAQLTTLAQQTQSLVLEDDDIQDD